MAIMDVPEGECTLTDGVCLVWILPIGFMLWWWLCGMLWLIQQVSCLDWDPTFGRGINDENDVPHVGNTSRSSSEDGKGQKKCRHILSGDVETSNMPTHGKTRIVPWDDFLLGKRLIRISSDSDSDGYSDHVSPDIYVLYCSKN